MTLNKISKTMVNGLEEELGRIEDKATATEQKIDTEISQVAQQLAQTGQQKADKSEVRLKSEKVEPEDWSERSIALATGQGTVNLLTIPQDNSVTTLKTTFIKEPINKIDKRKINYRRTLSATTGELVENQSFSASDFIEIKRNTSYVGSFNRIALYDSNKKFISSTLSGGSFNSGGAVFVRVVISNDTLPTAQLNEGSVLLAFEEYHEPIIKNIGLDGIEKESVLLAKQSTNLYNEKTKNAKFRLTSTGQLNPSSSYDTSDYIEVVPFTVYSSKAFNKVAFYDINKVFISELNVPSAGQSFTTPNGTRFVRLHHQFVEVVAKPQLNKGASVLPYESFYRRLEGVEISDLNVKMEDVAFLERTSNLFIEETSIKKTVVSSTGALNSSQTYEVTDFIKVSPGESYYFYGFISIARYNETKQFIARGDIPSLGTAWVAPSDCHYIRANYQPVTQSQYTGVRMINVGSEPLGYEKGGFRFKKDQPIILDMPENGNLKYTLDMPINSLFKTSEQYSDYTSIFPNITSASVYQMFDDLVTTYPNYISKEFLGNDGIGNEISVYKFRPTYPVHEANIKNPKVFINCGIHGYEHANTLITYLMLKQLCEKWEGSSLLEVLRFNIEIAVIPVSNPSGWNAFTRKNHNYVDLNRNFPSDNWTSGTVGTNTYAGTAPFDQIESRLIRDFLNSNKDIDIVYDFHNFKRDDKTTGNFLWIPAPRDLQATTRNLIAKMSREFKKDFSFLSNLSDEEFLGTTTVGADQTLSGYCRSLGIERSMTFEICEEWINDPNGQPYNQDVCKAGVESITNMLLMHLKEITN